MPTPSSSKRHQHQQPCYVPESESKNVACSRILFLISLGCAAGALGYLANHYAKMAEHDLAQRQFEALVDRVLTESVLIFQQKRLALVTMAQLMGQMHPHASQWPFVHIPGFEEIATDLLKATSGIDMGWCPILQLEDIEEWEAYAYKYYFEDRDPPFANNSAGVAPFGRGIWGLNTTTGLKYHDNQPGTPWNSTYPNIKTPLVQLEDGNNPILMQNMHHRPALGPAFDGLLDCVRDHSLKGDFELTACGSATQMFDAWKFQERGPAAAIYQAVVPHHNNGTMVAHTGSSVVFDVVLENVFAKTVSGVDCVISNHQNLTHHEQYYTYKVVDGFAHAIGFGDLHDHTSTPFPGSCGSLTAPNHYGSQYSYDYQLCIYPTAEFLQTHSTNNPMTTTIIALVVILGTSLMFMIYDKAVRREFNDKKELFEAKRRFIRFVSHEVRTPLNAVYMGITVIQTEIASSLGFRSVEELEQKTQQLASSSNESSSPTTSSESTLSSLVEGNETTALSFLKSKGGTSPALEWFQLAEEVKHSAENATSVLSDLLNFDKIECGQLHLELTVISFWRLIEETLTEFYLSATQKKIQLALDLSDVLERDLDIEDPLPSAISCGSNRATYRLTKEARRMKIIGDAVKLSLAFRNLVSNAIKFTPEGGTVRVAAAWCRRQELGPIQPFELKTGEAVQYPQQGELCLTVQDSGAGMSKDQLTRLFRAGVQFNVNELQAGQGSGLGLFISQGIVTQHVGTLQAHSEGLGKGTTFTMRLPLYDAPVQSDEEDITATSTSRECQPGLVVTQEASAKVKPMKILVVDDAPTNRKLLGRLLKNRGHQVDEAEDGQVAIEKVALAARDGNPYRTILLDFEMPRLKGPPAARIMRNQGHTAFIVGVTGNVFQEDCEYFRSCGADAVLPKPFSIRDLEEVWVENGVSAVSGKDGNEKTIGAQKGKLHHVLTSPPTQTTSDATEATDEETKGAVRVPVAAVTA